MKITLEEKKLCLNIIKAYIELSDKLSSIKKELIDLKNNLSEDNLQKYQLLKKEAEDTVMKMQTLISSDKMVEEILKKKYPNMTANTLRLNLYDDLRY